LVLDGKLPMVILAKSRGFMVLGICNSDVRIFFNYPTIGTNRLKVDVWTLPWIKKI